MIISHVKIIAFQTIIIHCLWIFYIARKDCSLYNKQNNTCVFGNTRFIPRVKHDCRPDVCVSYREQVINFFFKLIKRPYSGSYTLKQFIPQLCRVITESNPFYTIVCSWF